MAHWRLSAKMREKTDAGFVAVIVEKWFTAIQVS